jgi:hypothetical protein
VGGVVLVYFYYKVEKHKNVGLPSVGEIGGSSIESVSANQRKDIYIRRTPGWQGGPPG